MTLLLGGMLVFMSRDCWTRLRDLVLAEYETHTSVGIY